MPELACVVRFPLGGPLSVALMAWLRRRVQDAVSRPVQDAARVGGLADVLEVIGDDADEPGTQRDWRIPSVVHDRVEVRVARGCEKCERPNVHGVVLADQQVSRVDAHVRSRFEVLVVSGLVAVGRQIEALAPTIGDPALFGAGDVGDVIVLERRGQAAAPLYTGA